MSTQTYAEAIDAQRAALAANLTTMGVTSTATEALSALVPKVLTISDDADALATEILATKTAYVDGEKVTGSMTDNGANNVEVTDVDGTLIPAGYYNGSGSAVLSATEAEKVIASNIKDGVTILGVTGNVTGSSVLTGDAVVSEVLSGKTFYSNNAETQLTGTMPDREGDNAATSSSVDGTTLKLVAPTGFYDGTDTVTLQDDNFLAENIKAGVSVHGVEGSMVVPSPGAAQEIINPYDYITVSMPEPTYP